LELFFLSKHLLGIANVNLQKSQIKCNVKNTLPIYIFNSCFCEHFYIRLNCQIAPGVYCRYLFYSPILLINKFATMLLGKPLQNRTTFHWHIVSLANYDIALGHKWEIFWENMGKDWGTKQT